MEYPCISCLSVCNAKVMVLQSAKTNLNVEEVFFSIARDIKQRLADTDSKTEVSYLNFPLNCDGLSLYYLPHVVIAYYLINPRLSLMNLSLLCLIKRPSVNICRFSAKLPLTSLQPQTIKINQPDQGAGAAQAAQKSACCGS